MMDNHMFTAAGTLIARETEDGEVTLTPDTQPPAEAATDEVTPAAEAEAETEAARFTPDEAAARIEQLETQLTECERMLQEKQTDLFTLAQDREKMISQLNNRLEGAWEEINKLNNRLEVAREEYATFRRQAVERALQESRAHGGRFCDEIFSILRDIGFTEEDGMPRRERDIEIYTFTVTVETDDNGEVLQSAVDHAAIQYIRNNLGGGDWGYAD